MTNSKSNFSQPFLAGLGEQVRMLRAHRGVTHPFVAQVADVTESQCEHKSDIFLLS